MRLFCRPCRPRLSALFLFLWCFCLISDNKIPTELDRVIQEHPDLPECKKLLQLLSFRRVKSSDIFYEATRVANLTNLNCQEKNILIKELMDNLNLEYPSSVETEVSYESNYSSPSMNLRTPRPKRRIESSPVAETSSSKKIKIPKKFQRYSSSVKFENVIGEIPQKIKDLTSILAGDQHYLDVGVRKPTGVLLYGPPGTGKTLMAKAIAGETNAAFLYSSAASLMNSFQGSGAEKVKQIFKKAKKGKKFFPHVYIFFDELDAVGQSRGNDHELNEIKRTMQEIMIQMDGLYSEEERDFFTVFAATNRKEDLDEALIRPGRFDYHIEIGNPDYKKRVALLKYFLFDNRKRKIEDIEVEDLKSLADKIDKFSCSEIERLVDDAALIAAQNKRGIKREDFYSVIMNINKKNDAPPPFMYL